jgi:ABC-type transport system involved in multi-copper enzyme maturation permease subunit
MTFLPIVDRELRLAARSKATYRNRAITTAVVTGVALMMMLFGSLSAAPMYIGAVMFRTLSLLALLFCLLEGVRKTADCLSEEKREGTLGLLFLTDLKGYDVVLGKLAAMSLNSFYSLLAILPVLALPLLMGGVTPGEFWRMALALLNLLFFSLCAGVWVSSWSRTEHQAWGRTFAVMAVAAVPLFFPGAFRDFSPVQSFIGAFDGAYQRGARSYWHSLCAAQGAAWLLLIWASYAAPRCWQEKTAAPLSPLWRRWESLPFGGRALKARLRKQMLEENPVSWLAGRNVGQRLALSLLAGVVTIAAGALALTTDAKYLAVFVVAALVLNLALKMRVAAQACQCLAEARRNNALEMLLATPLTVDQIISGQILALKRIFLAPVLVILLMEFLGLAIGAAALGAGRQANDVVPFAIVIIPVYLSVFALDVVAVTWTGMWFGLTSKKESQAVTKTILWVLLAPFLCGFFYCFGWLLFIGWPIFWIAWSSQKLRQEFRLLAAHRYAGTLAGARWTLRPVSQSAGILPPVARP